MRLLPSTILIILIALIGTVCLSGETCHAQDDTEICLSCHEDEDIEGLDEQDEVISVYVNPEHVPNSVHAGMECVDCHLDLAGNEDYPHDEDLDAPECMMCHEAEGFDESIHADEARCWDCHGYHSIQSPDDSDVGQAGIDCSACHTRIAGEYAQSLHGEEVAKGAELAPRCWDCHGGHDIRDAQSAQSRVARFKIPFMCGECHKEGTEVTQRYDIPADSILFHYSQSIHGQGLYNQGLIVTAVCSDCHTAHNVRAHTDPESSIHRNNVGRTCEQCHGLIEEVHRKVIRGELWQKEPDKVPVCVDCHEPHQIRRVVYEEGMSDQECVECHGRQTLTGIDDGQVVSMHVDTALLHNSAHNGVTCAQCHTGATPGHDRPCATVTGEVDCSICHSDVVVTYTTSIHGKLAHRGDPDAPECEDCHGAHGILPHTNEASPTFPRNVPDLCAACHRSGQPAAVRRTSDGTDMVAKYEMSIHGKGLIESGLIVTAMCTDCHTAHHALPAEDSVSTVHRDNIAQTCAQCHNGIYNKFRTSIHSPQVSDEPPEELPVCNDCHASHRILRSDVTDFRMEIREQCGGCHPDVTESYFDTFHGKVSKLGYAAAAQCYDCHGSHEILPPDNPSSMLSRQNIVETCGQCHEGSHRNFAGYLTHATHHDRTKYPILFYTFWFMTTLLVGTLIVAGAHTLMWLPRSFQIMRHHRELRHSLYGKRQYRRFKPLHSIMHIMVIISFLGLAITGMTLKFSYLGWAQWLSEAMGGFESAGYIHRICALITFAYFFIHIIDLIRMKRRERKSWRQVLFDTQHSMLPNRNDLREAGQTIRWFLGIGERPKYGRWTYWEKFDYFAVFWGVAIIGTTGLMLWFPEFFTRFLPGWIINVATIVHSDEALLATAFIFTVHFFNTHFRPDKFPMDTVIFTGRVPLEELKEDRPREYEEVMRSRDIRKHLDQPPHPLLVKAGRWFGGIALLLGLSLILLIIYAEVFGYR